MKRRFNVTGLCIPEKHYMADISVHLEKMRVYIEDGEYFTVNRARQYGKTTVLAALAEYLKKDYEVISLDFQGISYADFVSEQNFVAAFSRQLLLCGKNMPDDLKAEFEQYADHKVREMTISALFILLLKWCGNSEKRSYY